jgi:Primase C terminal 2 (PriCT-2)/Family of unknown function (DUF5906)
VSSFFERVLPAEGPFTLFTGATGADGKLIEQRHWNGIKSHADVEKEVTRLSMLPLNVFFATGSYSGANRKDPIAKRAFWLDLDGKDFEGGVEQGVKHLGAFLKATGLPRPSIYVNSGRGIHVYWCLDRDLPVTEWKVIANALKAKCAELDFKADPTSTADPARVLRAPGSLNRKGEMPIPCSVMSDTGMTYAPDDLAKQLSVSPMLSGAVSKLAALVSNQDLVTKRDHENKSADQVRDMLTHINLPPYAGRDMWITVLCAVQDWSEKSAHGFEIFCEWSSNQPGFVSEEDCWVTWSSFEPGGGIGVGTLVKLARDAGWGEPVVPVAAPEAGASFMEAVAAQPAPAVASGATAPQITTIQKISPLLVACSHAVAATGRPRFEHNDAVVWLANEFVMVLDQESLFYSLTERLPLSKTIIDDLLTRYMPLNANGVPTNASMLMRRYGVVNIVNSQGFYPGMPQIYTENNRSYVNLYTDPPAKLVPTQAEADMFSDLWDYVFPREEDKAFGAYLLQFYAHVVQKPAVKITSAPLMISKEFGTGKTTTMWDIPRALCGGDNAKLVSNKVLRSAFSDYITGAQFLHFDEVHINGKWDSDDTANSLKNLVTGTSVEIHPKGLKPYNIPNRLFITATSNYEDAITLPSNDERRWGIYYLEPTRVMTHAERKLYFKNFHDWLTGPRGPGVLRYIFGAVDISNFNPHAPPPITAAKYAMVEKSQVNEIQIIFDALKSGDGPFCREVFTTEGVGQWLQTETNKTYSGMALRAFINRTLPDAKIIREIRQGDGKQRIWAFVNIEHWETASAEDIRAELKR